MAFPRSLLPLMALVALGSAGLVAAQQPLVPAFVWGNTEHLACGSTGQTNRVVYEVGPRADVLLTLAQPAEQGVAGQAVWRGEYGMRSLAWKDLSSGGVVWGSKKPSRNG